MAVAATTKMDEFQPENESIEAYLERIEIYFDVNGVADDKKVSVFLNALGGKTYTLLRNLLAPAKLNTKSLNDLTTALNNHYAPKRVVIAERFHFYRRNQAPGESIAEFVAELRKLSTHCSFKDSQLEEALRELRSVATQRRLLEVVDFASCALWIRTKVSSILLCISFLLCAYLLIRTKTKIVHKEKASVELTAIMATIDAT